MNAKRKNVGPVDLIVDGNDYARLKEDVARLRAAIRDSLDDFDLRDEISAIDTLRRALDA